MEVESEQPQGQKEEKEEVTITPGVRWGGGVIYEDDEDQGEDGRKVQNVKKKGREVE